MKYFKYFLLTMIVVLLDQALKLWVHFNMEQYGEAIPILGQSWAELLFVLNEGIAFGLKLSQSWGKLLLSLIRIIAVAGLGVFIFRLAKKDAHKGLLWTLALILGGALGNTIDSVFYGVLLEGNIVPDAPYAWFHGRVIDMLHFPMFQGNFPQWFPFWGGERFEFFRYIFNLADSAIFIGFMLVLFNQKKFLTELAEEKKEEAGPETEPKEEAVKQDSADAGV